MGFKCTPQILGLVRGEPKEGQKHRANGRAILCEAGKERISVSETIDRTLSYLNRYAGYESGFAAWDYMERNADGYKTQGKTKNGKAYERTLRKDAVIGFAVIINPPAEVCENWKDEDYQEFYSDTWDCLNKIEPRIFSDKNIIMDAEHFDEGIAPQSPEHRDRHLHRFGETKDSKGRYCGNLIDAALLSTINQKYPSMMRQKGWGMEDLDTTDWDRYKSDSEYRAERKMKRKQSGKSVNEYLKRKSDQQLSRLQVMTNEVESIKNFAVNLTAESIQESEKIAEEKQLWKEKKEKEQHDIENERFELEVQKEQQEKTEKEFQKREDALDAQREVLQEREDSLKPSGVVIGMLSMIEKGVKSLEMKKQVASVKRFVERNREGLEKSYKAQLERTRMNRQRVRNGDYFNIQSEKADMEIHL